MVKREVVKEVAKRVRAIQEDGKTIVKAKDILELVEYKLNRLNIDYFVFPLSSTRFLVELNLPEEFMN